MNAAAIEKRITLPIFTQEFSGSSPLYFDDLHLLTPATYSLPQGSSAFLGKTSPLGLKTGNKMHLHKPDHSPLSAENFRFKATVICTAARSGARHRGPEPRDNEMAVPAPGAGNYHHRYHNLTRGAASLNRLLLRRRRFPLRKRAEYFSR